MFSRLSVLMGGGEREVVIVTKLISHFRLETMELNDLFWTIPVNMRLFNLSLHV